MEVIWILGAYVNHGRKGRLLTRRGEGVCERIMRSSALLIYKWTSFSNLSFPFVLPPHAYTVCSTRTFAVS